MSTITHIPTRSLHEWDTLLDGASMLIVDSVEPDEMDDDVYWVHVTCCSGNFDNYETPIRADAAASWQVLNADR